MKQEKHIKIQDPLVIMFQTPSGEVVCHLHPSDYTYQHYGLLICDLVGHVAQAFKVEEDAVWEWVDKERSHRTTSLAKVQ